MMKTDKQSGVHILCSSLNVFAVGIKPKKNKQTRVNINHSVQPLIVTVLLVFTASINSPAQATDFIIADGVTQTTAQNLNAGDTLTIEVGGQLNTIADAITNPVGAGAEVTNHGAISTILAFAASIDSSGDDFTVTNSGTISATGFATIAILGTGVQTTVNLQSGSTIIGHIILVGTGNDLLTIEGGTTLNGNINMGDGTDTVTFDLAEAHSYAGVISNTESVIKNNTGSLTLTGANTYTGTTTINAGTLFVNGSITNSITTVNAGGTLGGTGTVGNVFINGGTFAPGNSIGTTNVTGNLSFAGGGNYDVEVNAAGNSDFINVTGTATLTGGTVNVQPLAGSYAVSTDYTILTATGGLIGTFDSVNSNLAFLDPTLSYVGNDVLLNLTRNSVSFTDVATTANQTAISTVLENNTTALQSIVNGVLALSNAEAQHAFDSLSGVQHTQGSVVINKLGQQFQQLLSNRSSQRANDAYAFNNAKPMQSYQLADNSDNWQAAYVEAADLVSSERGWWMQGFGGFGEIDDTTNASGANYNTQGFAFGLETNWQNLIVGVAGSYAKSNVDTFGGDTDIDSFQAATYVSWQRNDVYMDATVGLGLHKVDTTRTVTVGTSVNTASSDYDSITVNTAVETGKDINLDLSTTLTPYVGVEYRHSTRDDFTETGAGITNLRVSEQNDDSLRTALGLRLSRNITTQKGHRITPSAMIAYVHEHLDSVSQLKAGFSATPTSTFRIDGSDLDRDRLQVGLGISGQFNDKITLNVGYNGELSGSDNYHSVSATVRSVW